MKRIITAFSLWLAVLICHADESAIKQFVGTFEGDVEISQSDQRTLEVTIEEIKNGFTVNWKTIIQDSSGSGKSKSYSIDFLNSERPGIYGAAMKRNLFGGQEALDPIKGEPYFWSRLDENKLTVYGMLITENGDYEVQRYDRTVNGDDMLLVYTLTRGEEIIKSINATLTRQ